MRDLQTLMTSSFLRPPPPLISSNVSNRHMANPFPLKSADVLYGLSHTLDQLFIFNLAAEVDRA